VDALGANVAWMHGASMKRFKRFKPLLACLCLGMALPAWGGFSIIGTRVIYHDAQGEATVHMQRVTGDSPVLLQTWLDDGSPDAQPGAQDLPFLLTPAVARVDPGAAQVIRIVRIRNDVPDDREMLLYFNALEVPPAADASQLAATSAVQFAMQARMKFFYRPKGLEPGVDQAPALLRFSVHAADDGAVQLRIYNATPYHITMPDLGLYTADAPEDAVALAKFRATGIAPMVAPFDDLTVTLADLAPNVRASTLTARPAAELQVRYTVINDQGGILPKSVALGSAS